MPSTIDYYTEDNPPAGNPATVNATVDTVSSLPPCPFPLLVNMPAQGAYLGYGITVRYERSWGIAGSPVAGPYGTQAAFWRLHGGWTVKIVSWVAQMLTVMPPVPLPVTNDNEILLHDDTEIPHRIVMPDGNVSFTLAGVYIFGLQVSPELSDTLWGCIQPQDVGSITDNVLNPADYVTGLIGPTSPPVGFSGSAFTG